MLVFCRRLVKKGTSRRGQAHLDRVNFGGDTVDGGKDQDGTFRIQDACSERRAVNRRLLPCWRAPLCRSSWSNCA